MNSEFGLRSKRIGGSFLIESFAKIRVAEMRLLLVIRG
jgi:hypothetical protein